MRTYGALRWAWAAAAFVALAARPAAAQDPPPPMLPNEPEAPPPPPPPPDAPPRPDAPPPLAPLAPVAPPLQPTPAFTPVPPPPEAPAERQARSSARTLRGHSFVTPFFIDSAFVHTNVGVGVEIGRQWSPSIPTSGTASNGTVSHDFQYDQTLGVAAQYLSFGVAVTDRVELGFSAGYSSFLSSDVNTAILYGGKNAWNLTPGVRINLVRTTATQLGLHLYGAFGSSAWQNPYGVINEIAAEAQAIGMDTGRTACLAAGDLSCALKNAAFDASGQTLTTSTNYGGGITLAVAHAYNSIAGLQAAIGLDVAYTAANLSGTTVGSVPVAFHLGLAQSVDFGPSVPIALMAEYMFTVIHETGLNSASATIDAPTIQTLRNSIALGVYYTGRSDFVIGGVVNATIDEATTTYNSTDPTTMAQDQGQQPLTRVMGQVTARYFF